MTCTTGENGAFAFENVPYGHFIVAEIEAPALYTISPERHHVYIGTDGQVITIRVDNTLIRGSVQVIKTEAVAEPSAVENTNENTFMRFLSGAEFALYADTNGNKEFDSGISRSESSPKRTAATIRRKTCWKAVISSRKQGPEGLYPR